METAIASVGGVDRLTQTHVETVLLRYGIHSGMEGSIVYGVWVPNKDASQAIKVLREDLAVHPYRITLYDRGRQEAYRAPLSDRVTTLPRARYDDLIASNKYPAASDVGAVLRDPAVHNASRAFPYVTKILTLEQSCLDVNGRRWSGHEVDLEMVVSLEEDIGGTHRWLQAWDDGRHVASNGSNEWWSGDENAVAANQKKYDGRH